MQHNKDNHLAEPSQHANTLLSNCPTSSSSTPNGKRSYPPNLTDAEQTLLRDNKGCFKCCQAFAGHQAFEGKCDPQCGMNYLPITQVTIDAARKTCHNHPNNHVAVVAVAQNDPDSSSPPKTKVHPVAAIMPGISNPTAYHAANVTTILEGLDDSDDEVSNYNLNFVGNFIKSIKSIMNTLSLPKTPKEIAPLTIVPSMVPHLFWRALVSPPTSLPCSVDCLLDNSSHIVLIHDLLVNELGLHKRRLKMPIKMDIAINLSENEKSVTLQKFVKLTLYDTSGKYR